MEKEASWVGEGREKADVVNECYNKTGQQKPTLSVLCAADLCARQLRREGWLVAAHPIKCPPPPAAKQSWGDRGRERAAEGASLIFWVLVCAGIWVTHAAAGWKGCQDYPPMR